MIAVDTNILVYTHRVEMPFHQAARGCVARLAEHQAPWAILWPCIHEFLSTVTNPRAFEVPTPLRAAFDQIDVWLEAPTLALLSESVEHWRTLRRQIAAGRVWGPRVHDARIAAICLDNGVSELWSADRDFSRFPELRVVNPLVG